MTLTFIGILAFLICVFIIAIIYLFNKIQKQKLLKEIKRREKLEQERKSIEIDRKSQGESKGVDILINEFESGLWVVFDEKLLVAAMGKLKNMEVFNPLINRAKSIGFSTMELQHIPFKSREMILVAIAYAIAGIGAPAIQPCEELKQKYAKEGNAGGKVYFEHILGLIKRI